MTASDSGGRTKLGLADERVVSIPDRGNEEYLKDYPPPDYESHLGASSGVGSRNEHIKVIDDIDARLEAAKKHYPPNDCGHFFIPRDVQSEISTPKQIGVIVANHESFSNLTGEQKEILAREIYEGGVTFCQAPCRKLFTVTIGAELLDHLLELILDGMTDSCLPLRFDSDAGCQLRCQVSTHQHPAVKKIKPKHRGSLCQWTYAVSAMYLKKPPKGHAHYVLDSNDVFPFIQLEERGPSEARQTQQSGTKKGYQRVPDSTDGGFGQVQRISIHGSHFNFDPELSPCPSPQTFALKKLFSSDREGFDIELASLLSCLNQEDRHLIKLLATIEVKTSVGISIFYFVFPWAQGDLWHFWKMHDILSERDHRCPWMMEQCYQLAKGLMYVHNERPALRRFKSLDVNSDLYGRHGDIKADNILYFKAADKLVIADFGLGRMHTKISRSNVDPKTLEKTATYRAPEFDTPHGKISRASDIFSLGCVFLEFVTWYLLGWDAVNELFPTYRQDIDIYGFLSDTFFSIGESETPEVKPKVREWVWKLRKSDRCNPCILQFLDTIEGKMLHPDPKERVKSGPLVRELELLTTTCRRDSSYYKEEAHASSP